MRRQFNYTGRIPIKRESVKVQLKENEHQPPSCSINVSLENYGFPPDAQLFLEIFDRYAFQREALGSLSSFEPKDSINITELISREALRFRLKVVDESHGRIVGEAKGLATTSPQAPDSLLPFQLDDLTDIVYELDCSTHEQPLLRVNERLLGIDIVLIVERDPIFHALVLPAVVKEILNQIVVKDDIREIEGNKWQHQWLYYIIKDCHFRPPPSDSDEEEAETDEDWINDAVKAFSRSHSFIEDFETRYRMVRANEQ